MKIHTNELSHHVGEQITLQGFANTIRRQGGIVFVLLRDLTGMAQCVVWKGNEQAFEAVKELTTESVVSVTGTVKAEPQAPGGFEVSVEEVQILSLADPELPIPVNVEKGAGDSDQSIRWDHRWLDLRRPEMLKTFKTWTALEAGFREYYASQGYVQVYTPSFMSTASESGSEVFEVKYFDRKAYLAQSPQFYKQMAMSAGFEKVFVMGPVFRAEPSFTTRHMTEFTGWDFEISYVESHYDVMAELEKVITSGFKKVAETVDSEVTVPTMPFPKISMEEAKAKLSAAGIASEKAGDLSPEEERELCKMIKEETGSDFVFVTDYPITVRPFYHMRHGENLELTKSFDLLYRGLEITTGAQREHRVEILEKQALEKGMHLDELKDYIDFFRYGCPPHGGVGIGPGRIIMKLMEAASVKDVTFLPRDVKRLTP